jgi:exodeoxyribonuclease V alpha subunit
MSVQFKGTIEKITFYNPESQYAILKLSAMGEDAEITVCGSFISPSEGEYLLVEGEWVNHPKYGRQVRASSSQKLPLPTIEAVERYLASGVIKGIGPVRARQIVEKFGENAMEIIEKEPERLAEIHGIGKKKIPGIKKSMEGQRDLKAIMLALQSFQISPAWAMRIYREYGKGSYQVVKENPYKLAEDIQGIGFLTADKIAQRTGIPKDSPRRAEAGLVYLLEKMAEEGHVFSPYSELLARAEKELSIGKEPLLKGFASLIERGKIKVENMPGTLINNNEKAVYLKGLYEAECDTAHGIKKLLTVKHGSQQQFLEVEKGDLLWAQKEMGIKLSPRQLEAIKGALREQVFIITGGPGVGKTTIIRAILKIYKEKKKKEKVLLAAPTGRAAKRLSEFTGEEAKTIHRLLEYNPREDGFRRNELNPLEGQLLIVDETSMVDIALMSRLLKAMPEGAGLILVGDVNQLASVGPGSVLRDLIDSGTIKTVRLDEIFRQSGESLITENAHKINRGEMPSCIRGNEGDFFFIEKNEPEEVLAKILELCGKSFPARFGIKEPLRDIQVLSPMHKGVVGVTNLNRALQELLNKSAKPGGHLKSGDKVMQVKNNYDKDVYNGDTGIVKYTDEGGLTVDFDGREIKYEPFEAGELQLSYAASVHKSQGSEYPAVIMPLVTEHFILLQRNLLYTAVTRAKKLMVLVGSRKALAIAVKNSKIERRYTGLKERLLAEFQGLHAPAV